MKKNSKTQTATAIRKVAVIGSGVMGAGIAAQVANAGVPVLLLDIVPAGAADRTMLARTAIEKLKKTSPAALMSPAAAHLITPGNLEDDLSQLADVDWVVEAVIERLDIKQALYRKVAAILAPHALLSSNTSTIPLAELARDLPPEVACRLLITHFFNPPRYMRLLEWVAPVQLDSAAALRLRTFIDERLGKTVVACHDTPGFIANRIGTFWLHAASTMAIMHQLDVVTADALLGRPAGVPKTGVFGLMDLVGLDLMPHVLTSLKNALPATDAFHALGDAPALMATMIANGLTGRKGPQGGAGFYRLTEDKKKQVIDLATGAYMPQPRPSKHAQQLVRRGRKDLRALLSHPSREGRYAWAVLSATLAYAADLVGPAAQAGIADDLTAIDAAMRLGYNWKYGPFELLDRLGTGWVTEKLRLAGQPVPAMLQLAAGRPFYRTQGHLREFLGRDGRYHALRQAPGVLLLADVKRGRKPVLKNLSASVWDAGDGVAVFEFHSKMNALNPLILHLLGKSLHELPLRGFKAMVIHNDGTNFSVGANILMLKLTGMLRAWPLINLILKQGQTTLQRVKYAPFPVVAAPTGMALGGGAEVLLHSHAVVAGAETYIGLVEGGVGIIPGWGGCKELVGRALSTLRGGPMVAIAKVFETIATARVAKSAAEARDLLFLRDTDTIVMNPDRVLAVAKARALAMVDTHRTPAPHVYPLPGRSAQTALKLALHDFALKGMATPHDLVVGRALAATLSGGDMADLAKPPLSEADLLALERHHLVALAKTPATRARINHMLAKGKPLRN